MVVIIVFDMYQVSINILYKLILIIFQYVEVVIISENYIYGVVKECVGYKVFYGFVVVFFIYGYYVNEFVYLFVDK